MTKETYESSDTDPNRENEATILPPGERERSSGRSDGRASERSGFVRRISFVGCIPLPCKSCLYSQSRRTSELADTDGEGRKEGAEPYRLAAVGNYILTNN